MSVLVDYGSSDGDDAVGEASQLKIGRVPQDTPPGTNIDGQLKTNGNSKTNELAQKNGAPEIGPSIGPSNDLLESGTASAPQSPYSANRALIRDLTLPTVTDFNIPDSPPGSPPPGLDEKFGQFLKLKKQGIHFNEKLARSSALKNPSLLRKLMNFAGVDESEQYATTLPSDIWDPEGFTPSAYKEELAKSQQSILKKREEERAKVQRESIDFVSASVSGPSSRAGTLGTAGIGKGLRGSAAERVMAGLDRDRVRSPQTSNLVSRGSTSGRNPRTDDRESRWKTRSRSPGRRKRSVSR
ncbi:hypothetical protein MMC26_001285 [Xylographa opegraphella]|nr:hypothetical protein [Xylographa opegraphella]